MHNTYIFFNNIYITDTPVYSLHGTYIKIKTTIHICC